jgi:hypothetical protein
MPYFPIPMTTRPAVLSSPGGHAPTGGAGLTGAESLRDLQARVLETGRVLDWAGYSKHDGLNAPWLEAVAGRSRILRLASIQLVMRCPLHVRPWIGVRPARDPKGLALFSRALLFRARTLGEDGAAAQARELLDWLLAHPAPGFELLAWGYPYPWQDVGFFAPRHFPNRVVTSNVAQALMDGYETLGERRYLEAAGSVVRFLLEAPRTLFEDADRRCVSYVPSEEVNWIVMDVPALAGAVAARYAALTDDPRLMGEAGRLIRYVVSKQTAYGAWFYTEPPGASHITHDNYHTGIILDAVLAYGRLSGRDEFAAAYRRGLEYYRDHLFDSDGAPRFMNHRPWPRDIHGAAQGIITFSLAQRATGAGRDMAERVLRWTLSEMWDPDSGWFHYQKRRLASIRIPLLRWGQAWMAYALGVYLEHCGDDA